MVLRPPDASRARPRSDRAPVGGRPPQRAIAAFAAACVLAGSGSPAHGQGQTLHGVVFSEYFQESGNSELLRRLWSPLVAARLARQAAEAGEPITGQPVNLAAERYLVHVPPERPAAGYGLLVFVPPWQEERLPPGWREVLDRLGFIFVSAERSGNDENVNARREPLALLPAHNAARRYPVDPERVYVGGFSGGSRVALRLALAFPDVFRGALLNAGADPIGTAAIPLPPRALLLQFQSGTHLVFVTGARDSEQVTDGMGSMRSLRRWCAFQVDSYLEPLRGHEIATPEALAWALRELDGRAAPDPASL